MLDVARAAVAWESLRRLHQSTGRSSPIPVGRQARQVPGCRRYQARRIISRRALYYPRSRAGTTNPLRMSLFQEFDERTKTPPRHAGFRDADAPSPTWSHPCASMLLL